MRVNKAAVLQAASEIADEQGLNNVSLKAIAEKLGIKTPSLYNHINSLDDLLRDIAHTGMLAMNSRMTQVSIGSVGDAAIKKVGVEYLNYMIEHPGIYETIQWATWHGTEETARIYNDYINLLKVLLRSCNIQEDHIEEALNLITAVFHGYTTLQLRYAFSEPEKVRNQLLDAIDTVLKGIYQKYRL